MDFALAKTRESYGYNTAYSYPFEERRAGRPTKRVNPIQDRYNGMSKSVKKTSYVFVLYLNGAFSKFS